MYSVAFIFSCLLPQKDHYTSSLLAHVPFMCIFLALPTTTWYLLWSNRDEQISRATDIEVTRDSARTCSYVKDLVSGGTWLAVHENWIYAVLLNAPSMGIPGFFATRGMMALQVMERSTEWYDLSTLTTKIQQELPRETYRSCIFAVGGMQEGTLKHQVFTWYTQTKQLDHQEHTWSLFLSSPNLYTPAGHDTRSVASKHVSSDITSLKEFMSSHIYDVHNPLCIVEDDVGTRSTSIITVDEHVRYAYEIRA